MWGWAGRVIVKIKVSVNENGEYNMVKQQNRNCYTSHYWNARFYKALERLEENKGKSYERILYVNYFRMLGLYNVPTFSGIKQLNNYESCNRLRAW